MALTMKNFTSRRVDDRDSGKAFLYFTDEDGRDWYESQSLFADDTLKIAYNADGVINSYSYDASTLAPGGLSVTEFDADAVPDGFFDNVSSWMVSDGAISTLTGAALTTAREKQRDILLTAARVVTSDYQNEALIGLISDDDAARFKQWVVYVKSLKSLDLTADDIAWPVVPDVA